MLGVDPVAETVYRGLLECADEDTAALAQRLGIDLDRLVRAIESLTDLGLVRSVDDAPLRCRPVAPRAALTGLIHRRQSELELARAGIEDLADAFRQRNRVGSAERLVEVVMGREAIIRRADELADSAQSEIRVFDTPPHAADVSRVEVDREQAQLSRGLRVLSLYSQASLELPGRTARVLRLIELGEQARVLPTLPLKLHIYDQRIAIVPLTATREATESVAIVHRSGLLKGLIALFDALWVAAHPIGAVDDAPADNGQRPLLTMLAAGLKDDAIARQLGVNVRTARRHISGISRLLNATSRFQAGVAAHRRNWVP